jgi:hypothetical protein
MKPGTTVMQPDTIGMPPGITVMQPGTTVMQPDQTVMQYVIRTTLRTTPSSAANLNRDGNFVLNQKR